VSGTALTKLRREDLAASIQAYRAIVNHRAQWRLLGVGFAGFFALGGLMLLALSSVSAPAWLSWVALAASWAWLFGAGALLLRRNSAARTRYALSCPSCSVGFIDRSLEWAGPARAELVLATGRCYACDAVVFDAGT
jgi:hypothetical protein